MKLNINNISEDKLIDFSIKDLNLELNTSQFITSLIVELELELKKKGFIKFRPHVYLGDEWFSPEGEAAISIPFYLAHPRLTRLEKKYTGEAEGETKPWFMSLLRHEVGHCLDHVYSFSKTKEWKKIFGNPKKDYDPDNYSYDSKSTDFVINLQDHYAQSHPDEDFAETFAVWLEKEKTIWSEEYKNMPNALEKLNYVDKICSNIKDKKTSVLQKNLICKASRLRISLKKYYHNRRRQLII